MIRCCVNIQFSATIRWLICDAKIYTLSATSLFQTSMTSLFFQAICTAYVERFHLSPTPRISVGVHRTADSVSAPRAFHPRQDLCFSAAPIACDGFVLQGTYHARTVAGQEYHYPYCLSSPYRELTGTYSRLFSLLIRQDRPRTEQLIRWRSRCHLPGTSWRNR